MDVPRPVVLVVDDDEGVRECLALVLEDRYDVVPAASGFEALVIAAARALDAVLLDVRMPNMDGIEVLRRLRAFRTDLPVVLLTAVDSVGTAVTAMKLGAVDYLTKPTADADLLAALENAIAGTKPASEVVVWHAGGDLGRRAVYAALVGMVADVSVAPPGAPIIDGGLDPTVMLTRLSAVHPRIAARFAGFGPFTSRLAGLIAAAYRAVTVEGLAGISCCSPRQLRRRFGDETHVTLRDYLVRVRIEAAKCLLVETTVALDAVGEEAGFYDTSHFTRIFRHCVGTTPGLYRRGGGLAEKYKKMAGRYIA
jgi:CheY-like chemotaxis protein/AraC-like DNA-binding protein